MANQYQCVYFIAIFIGVLLASQAGAYTDPVDVAALEELYNTLNQPPQLTGWRLDGGDPCDESWKGVSCSGSSVIYLNLHGLNLSGYITAGLYNLYNLKQLDISSNSIGGEIPYVLPPNATHINMACNFFTQNIPLSLHAMKSLQHLNLSHNLLSGPIGNAFTGLQNLREMDLSYNNFTGDLPTSFGSLTNLTGLYLQNNQFTGSVAYLAKLPLSYLNLSHNLLSGSIGNGFADLQNLQELDLSYNNFTGDLPTSSGSLTNLTGLYLQNNQFTGSVAYLAEFPPTHLNIRENYFIPNHVPYIPNLWIGRNSCQVSGNNCPPRDVPLETKETESELKPGQKKRLGIFGTLMSFIVAAASITACMAARRDPNNGQPPEQPVPAPVAAASKAHPNLFRPKFRPEKAKSPLHETFESSWYELKTGGKVYTGESGSQVEKLAYPDQQKVKTVRNLSFVNEQGEVEDSMKDDDD